MKNPRLERLNKEHRTAEIRLTREKHRQKQQLAEAKELTRKHERADFALVEGCWNHSLKRQAF